MPKGLAREHGSEEPLHAMRPAGVLRLQRTVGNAAATALLTRQEPHLATGWVVQRQPKSKPNPVDQAGQALRDFEAWADDEKKRQNVVDKAAVVGLDPKQAASVQAAAVKIAGYIPTMQGGRRQGRPVDRVPQDRRRPRHEGEAPRQQR